MSIRPADMQNMIHRTTQVERVENNERNAMQHSMQRNIDVQQQQISKTVVNVAKDANVNKDGHNKQEQERKDKKRKKQKEDNEKNNRSSESLFDVSV